MGALCPLYLPAQVFNTSDTQKNPYHVSRLLDVLSTYDTNCMLEGCLTSLWPHTWKLLLKISFLPLLTVLLMWLETTSNRNSWGKCQKTEKKWGILPDILHDSFAVEKIFWQSLWIVLPRMKWPQNHRMAWGGKDLNDHLFPTLLPLAGTTSIRSWPGSQEWGYYMIPLHFLSGPSKHFVSFT